MSLLFVLLLAFFQISHAENSIATSVASGILADVCEQNDTCNHVMGIATVIVITLLIATLIAGFWQLSDIAIEDAISDMVGVSVGYAASRALRKRS